MHIHKSYIDGSSNASEVRWFNSAKKDFSKREQTGIKIQILNHDDISDLEPNINNIFYKGALFEGSYFAKNPKKVSQLLINLFVKTNDGKNIGKVISVQNYGSSDLLEIRKKNAKDYFIPISENTIKKIDLIKKIIITKNINDYIG